MCYTSFCWHASLTVKGGKMDMSTIYLLCIYLFGLCGVRLLTYVNFRSPVLLAVLVNSTNGGALYLGYKTYKKNQEEGIKEWEVKRSEERRTVGAKRQQQHQNQTA
jgi:hypothetical protein